VTQIVPDGRGGQTEAASPDQVAAELLGEESTSSDPELDADESADPEEASAAEGDVSELTAEELADLAEDTTEDTSAKGLKELKDFIDKSYNGDVQAFITGWHNNNARMKEFSQKLDSIESAVQAGKFDAEEAEDIPEDFEVTADADVTFYSENIESLEQEINQSHNAVQHFMSEAGKAGLKLERLEGKLENADDSEISSIRSEIASVKAQMDQSLQNSRASEKEAKSLQKQLKQDQRALKQAERQAEKERSEFRNQHKQQRQTAKKIGTDAGVAFSTTAASLMSEYGVPESEQKQQTEELRALVSNQLRSLGPDAPLQDIEAMTKALGKAKFGSLDAITRAKFGKTNRTKTSTQRATKRVASPSASPAAKSKPRSQMTQRDYEEQAAKIGRYYDSL
jgi:predicted  nucleic acid-binding Zn-ribbon protein